MPLADSEHTPVLVKAISSDIFELVQRGTLLQQKGEQWEFVGYTPRKVRIQNASRQAQFKLTINQGEAIFTLPPPESAKRTDSNGQTVYVLGQPVAPSLPQAPAHTPAHTPSAVQPPVDNVIERLTQLALLRESGAISQDEFDSLKSRLLS
ncbi:SHOCT domain-containing protein [Deinococcus hohokamensis]|uniref:SHOCT domain-containing protein n=1 Tax=Deinococcus hohokamensis TaxID=309883 RepID=A0ABV9IF35_9DEIO